MKNLITCLLGFAPFILSAQFCDSFSLTLEDELELGCLKNTITTLHDQLGREYLYTANTVGGLSVIDLSDPTNMESVVNLPSSNFDNLTVNRITQHGEFLYVSLGSLFGSHDQPSGLAIINVTNPLSPVVTDVWASETNGGAAHVGIRGHLAYLCGLSNGVIVLNISDNENIHFVSQYIPPTDWPVGTDVGKIKARNIVFDGNLAYLAYDAGGLRVLDISNPLLLTEVGHYSNPALNGAARAYNNIVRRDKLLYVAVDYAGMEVLDVTDPSEILLHGWWNPNNFPLGSPAATSLRWFESPWHTNEIDLIDACGIIFMSCGRTEIVGVDVSDPTDPVLCGFYGDSTDNISSYGMTVYEDHIYVGHICSPIPIPFPAAWSGVKSLVYNSDCPLGVAEFELSPAFAIFPNPAANTISITNPDNALIDRVSIYDLGGMMILQEQFSTDNIDVSTISSGIYVLQINSNGKFYTEKLIIK